MLIRLFQQRRCRATAGCLPSPDTTPGITHAVTPCAAPHSSLAAAGSYADLAVQALYQSGQLHAGAAVSVLLDPQQTLAAAANKQDGHNAGRAQQHAQARQQTYQEQASSQPVGLQQVGQAQNVPHQSHGAGTQQPQLGQRQQWQQSLQRPLYIKAHVEQQAQLIRSCSGLEQLQAFLLTNMQQLPPNCLAEAMKQLAALHQIQQQEQQQLGMAAGRQTSNSTSSLVSSLAQQLCIALLQQLPSASAQALTGFLAAAAAARIMLPSDVLERLASYLVHNALRTACLQQKQQQQRQRQVQPPHARHLQPRQLLQHQKLQHGQLQGNVAGQQQLPTTQPAFPRAGGLAQRPHLTASAAWVLAQLQVRQPSVWAELASISGEQLEQLAPQDCVMLCWCLARARHYDPRLYHALLQRVMVRAKQLSPDSISCVLWSCARVGHYHHAAVSALVLAAASSMERFSPRALSRCLWSCGVLRHYEPRLLRAARVRALARMHQFEPHSLVLVLNALAKFEVHDEQLTAAVAAQARQCLAGFTMQALANLAWALAKQRQQQQDRRHGSSKRQQQQQLQHNSEAGQQVQQRLLADICISAVPCLPLARPQEVCNLLWACAVMKHRHQPCLEAACSRLVAVAEDAKPRDLAQAVWALEVLRYRRKTTQQVLVLQALNKLHLFGPQALSNWAWAVASSAMQMPRGLPAAVAQQFRVLLPQLTPQGVATTLWALSKMGKASVSQETLHAASKHILTNITCYNAQDLCNIAMVCCKASYREPALLQGLANAAANAASVTLQLQDVSRHSHSHSLPMSSSRLPAQSASPTVKRPAGSTPHQQGTPLIAVAHSAMRQKQLTAQAVCNLVWAFAGLGWHEPWLMQQLEQLAVQLITQGALQPERIAGLLQGFALLGESCAGLLGAVAKVESATAQRTRPADNQLSTTSGANGSSSSSRTPAQDGSSRQQWQQQLGHWPADSLALLIWAAAVSGAHETHGGLVVAALQQLQVQGVSGLSAARCAQLHLAFALLATDWGLVDWGQDCGLSCSNAGSKSNSSTRDTSNSKLTTSGSRAEAERLSQLQQHRAGRMPANAPASVVAGVLSGKLVQQCAAAWKEQEARSTLSQAEEELAQALQSMGLQPLVQRWLRPVSGAFGTAATQVQPSRLTPQPALSYYTLRIGVGFAAAGLGPGRRPVHIDMLPAAAVSSSWPARVLGKTALRQRCLQAAGWEVVMLTWQEWEACGQQRGAQRQLLRKLLQLDTV